MSRDYLSRDSWTFACLFLTCRLLQAYDENIKLLMPMKFLTYFWNKTQNMKMSGLQLGMHQLVQLAGSDQPFLLIN